MKRTLRALAVMLSYPSAELKANIREVAGQSMRSRRWGGPTAGASALS